MPAPLVISVGPQHLRSAPRVDEAPVAVYRCVVLLVADFHCTMKAGGVW